MPKHIPVRITDRSLSGSSYRYQSKIVNSSNLIELTGKTYKKKKVCLNTQSTFCKTVTFSYWNADSVKNKTASIYDYLCQNNIDILTLVETWLFSEDKENSVYLNEMLPKGYCVTLCSRPNGRVGGGICVIYKDSLHLKVKNSSNRSSTYSQFEFLDCSIRLTSDQRSSVRLVAVYRPPPTEVNLLSVKMFWKDWSRFLHSLNDCHQELIIVGDLNFHLDDLSHSYTKRFNSTLKQFSLRQHINQPTFTSGHILDVLITNSESTIIDSSIQVHDPGLSDNNGHVSTSHHLAINWSLSYEKPKPSVKVLSYRNLNKINKEIFSSDLAALRLEEKLSETENLNAMVDLFSDCLRNLINKHAPIQTRRTIDRSSSPWFTPELACMKQTKRRLERVWKKSCLEVDHVAYRRYCVFFNRHLHQARIRHSRLEISESKNDKGKLFKVCHSLIGNSRHKKPNLQNCQNDVETANAFSSFFIEKVRKIMVNLMIKPSR